MEMKKIAAAALISAGMFGIAGSADAATGVVNVNAVLQNNAAFQKAGKTVAAEQQKLQKQYNEESQNMTKKDKEALAQKLNQQLSERRQSVMDPIQKKFDAAVAKAAKDKKVDTVIAWGGMLYGTIDVDLTEDVKANMK